MRFLLISAGFFVLAMPVLALAADYVPLAPIPNLDGGEGATLESYINSLFLLIISVGAMLAVARVVIGGFQYMTQTASTTATSNARQTIRDAVIGLILLLSVYLILSVVNPQILDLSALKFENLAPSDEVQGQIDKNRKDAEEREARLRGDVEILTKGNDFLFEIGGLKAYGSFVNVTDRKQADVTYLTKQCGQAGKKAEIFTRDDDQENLACYSFQ